MLHCFRALGVNIALDVLSGATRTGRHGFRGPDRPGGGPRPAQGAACQILPEDVDELLSEIERCARRARSCPSTIIQTLTSASPASSRPCACTRRTTATCAAATALPPRATSTASARSCRWRRASARLAGGPFRQPPSIEVDFFGGEPLMNYDGARPGALRPRTGKETRQAFQLTITTNALGLTDERIEFLNREMHNIVLSIDGRREGLRLHAPHGQRQGLTFDEAVKRAKSWSSCVATGSTTCAAPTPPATSTLATTCWRWLTRALSSSPSSRWCWKKARLRADKGNVAGNPRRVRTASPGFTWSGARTAVDELLPLHGGSRRRAVREKARQGLRRGQRIRGRHPEGDIYPATSSSAAPATRWAAC